MAAVVTARVQEGHPEPLLAPRALLGLVELVEPGAEAAEVVHAPAVIVVQVVLRVGLAVVDEARLGHELALAKGALSEEVHAVGDLADGQDLGKNGLPI